MINRGASGWDAPGILCLWIIWAIAWEGEVVARSLLQAQQCFFHEGTALFAGKVAPGRWAELVGLQLPFPEVKGLSSFPPCLSVVGTQRGKARVGQPCLKKLGIAYAEEELREIHVPDAWGFLRRQVRVPECHHAEGMRRTALEA